MGLDSHWGHSRCPACLARVPVEPPQSTGAMFQVLLAHICPLATHLPHEPQLTKRLWGHILLWVWFDWGTEMVPVSLGLKIVTWNGFSVHDTEWHGSVACPPTCPTPEWSDQMHHWVFTMVRFVL